MSPRLTLAVIASLCLASMACGHSADAVVIVEDGGRIAVQGKVAFINEGGRFRPNIWKAGNVVIFRVDGNLGDERGEAGNAYRMNEANRLEELEAVDLTKSNEELAARYGVDAK